MNSRTSKELEIGVGLKLTFGLLIALILGGNGLLLWQFHLARLQTERLTEVSQELIGVLRLQVSLLSVHQRLDVLAQSRDAGRLASESEPLSRTFLEETQAEMSALTRLPYETHVDPEFQPTLEAIETILPTQLEPINGLAASGDWTAVRLRLDNELKPIESLCASLVAGIDREVSEEMAHAVANRKRALVRILLVLPATAISTFLVAAFLAWAVTRRIITLRMHERVEVLRASERNLRQIVDCVPGFVCALSPEGELELVNRQLLEYFGKTFEEMKSWATNDSIHPDDRPHSVAKFRNSIKTGTPHELEQRCRRADGVYRWFQRSARPVRDTDGRITAWYVLITDIEDQKRTEEALRQAQGDLARVNRVTTMGELTASLAHEISQPISGAMTNANVCLRKLGSDKPDLDEVRTATTRIVRDTQRAAEIIKRIRSQFERSALDRQVLDVNEINRETVALLRDQAARYNISVRTELAADLPQIVGDRVQLQQVAMNLIVNSIEAMKDVDGLREIVIKSQLADNEQILVSFSDTGIGFPPQLAEQIFDPFFTTKPHGTGMGLRISRSIIESHGGRLWTEAASGRGAIFRLNLPAAIPDHR
jgi:PAS domain S-box-containing protein